MIPNDSVESPTVLAVRGLSVEYTTSGVTHRALDGVSLEVPAGRITALVGESGSGKSTLARTVVGALAGQARITAGALEVSVPTADGGRRPGRIAYVPQAVGESLNPLRRIGSQVIDVLRAAGGDPRRDLGALAAELLDRVGLPDPRGVLRNFPHELSGGMRQRVLIAMAVARRPDLLVADEPTSALDVVAQRHILDLVTRLSAELELATLLITHDIGLALDTSASVAVLRRGRLLHHGPVDGLPQVEEPYVQELLGAGLAVEPRQPPGDPGQPVLATVGAARTYRRGSTTTGLRPTSLTVGAGERVGIVGPSGSGKTTFVRIAAGMVRPESGEVLVLGRPRRFSRRVDPVLTSTVQLVHQDPAASIDPRFTVGRAVREPLLVRGERDREVLAETVDRALREVGLPVDFAGKTVTELSGGQVQRVAIARALVVRPQVLVLDEALSALDAVTKLEIVDLLRTLSETRTMSIVLVSHDLNSVRRLCERLVVFAEGEVVADGSTRDVLQRAAHLTTRQLIDAEPGAHARVRLGDLVNGERTT